MRFFFRSKSFKIFAASLSALIVIVIVVAIFSKVSSPISSFVGAITTPFQKAFSTVSDWVDGVKDKMGDNQELMNEIERLKAELAQKDAMAERLAREGEEFHALYPDANMQDLPDSVWQDVGRGIPIAAAYALFERRRYTTEQKALEYNHANARRSSGSLEPTAPDYYSPAEVRAMSQSEVRANYDKIMRSMQKWH